MGYYKDTPRHGGPDGEVAALVYGMGWVWKRGREGIIEDGSRFVKVNAVFREIGGGLLGVPLENHAGSLPLIPLSAAEHRVKLRNANEMTLPFSLMQLRFVNFNALLGRRAPGLG